MREAEQLLSDLTAAAANWNAVGEPAADVLRHTITSVEQDLERQKLEHLRERVASFLDRRTLGASPVEPGAPSLDQADMGREGLGL